MLGEQLESVKNKREAHIPLVFQKQDPAFISCSIP